MSRNGQIVSSRSKDLFFKEVEGPPLAPDLVDLAEDPAEMRRYLFSDDWRPWLALICGDGRWAAAVISAVDTFNAGPTDIVADLGGPHLIAQCLREGKSLDVAAHSINLAHDKHRVVGVQLVTHPLCGMTKDRVCELHPGGQQAFDQPTKLELMDFYQTMLHEMAIHREDLEMVKDWIFESFPFITTVQFLRSVKFCLRTFGEYERAFEKASNNCLSVAA